MIWTDDEFNKDSILTIQISNGKNYKFNQTESFTYLEIFKRKPKIKTEIKKNMNVRGLLYILAQKVF